MLINYIGTKITTSKIILINTTLSIKLSYTLGSMSPMV